MRRFTLALLTFASLSAGVARAAHAQIRPPVRPTDTRPSLPAAGRGMAPPDTRPWSVRMAESTMRRNPQVYPTWDYTAGLVLLGIDRLGTATRDPKYARYVKENVDRLVNFAGAIRGYSREEYNLDEINEGRLLLALAARSREPRYLRAADVLREQLRTQPRTSEGGFWHKQIYPQQMWLDGLYMAEPFYAQYAAVRRDTAAFTDVARQFLLTARHTRDPETGLMYHAWDASHSQFWADTATGLSPNFWGRAMGWYAMAIVDALDYLPVGHPDRPAMIRVFQDMAASVAKVQDPVTGLWWQVMDEPNRTGNYLESSASSMFAYALGKGARMGYLAPEYRVVANRGFDGLVKQMVSVDGDGLVTLNGICKVAGLGGKDRRDGSYRYYVNEPTAANDYKGVGAFILAAVELGR
jgi:unsaturated rhamnogalacturonyl hydrolase